MYIVGPLPMAEDKRYLLRFIDRHSSWLEAVPNNDITSTAVCKALTNTWISRFGPPEIIITDQGRQFLSSQFKTTCERFGIEHRQTTAYHPQCNGKIERFHRSLKNALRAHSETCEQTWVRDLPIVLLGLRNATITGSMASPAQLLYGSSTRLPGDIITDNENQEHYTEDHVTRAITEFGIPIVNKQLARKIFLPQALKDCKYVWIKTDNSGSLKPPYDGPYEVLSRSDDLKTFDLKIDGCTKKVSIDRLKPTFTCHDTPHLMQGYK